MNTAQVYVLYFAPILATVFGLGVVAITRFLDRKDLDNIRASQFSDRKRARAG